MSTEKILRKASEQRFTLYARSLHPEIFNIYAEREINREAYSCTVWIIGSSHVVTFRAGRKILSEVLAGTDQELPVQFRIGSFSFAHNPQTSFRYDDGISYDARFDYRRFDRDAFAAKAHEIRHAVVPNGVIQSFGLSADPGTSAAGAVDAQQPLTAVGFSPQDRFINIRTFHTFPEDLVVIETHSRWEVRFAD